MGKPEEGTTAQGKEVGKAALKISKNWKKTSEPKHTQ